MKRIITFLSSSAFALLLLNSAAYAQGGRKPARGERATRAQYR